MRWLVSIAFSIAAWAQTAPFAPPEDISFRRANIMSEGTRMSAEVFAPKASAGKKLPTILMAHGWGGTAALLRPDAIAFARAGYLAVRHPPRSGWLDELGRLKGGRVVGLGVARGAPYGSLQNCPAVPSAASCSRMYWRTCSSSNPTVETA